MNPASTMSASPTSPAMTKVPFDLLQSFAEAVAVFAVAALLLALIVAVMLLVLEELGLRKLGQRWVIQAWLGPSPWNADEKVASEPAEVLTRAGKLLSAFSWSEVPILSPDNTLEVFWAIVGPSLALPPRKLLGVLSAAVQSDIDSPAPSPFTCWLAARGSMPVTPSPFSGLEQLRLPAPGSDPKSLSDAEAQQQAAARHALQTHVERALDALQVSLSRRWVALRHLAALALSCLITIVLMFPPGLDAVTSMLIFSQSLPVVTLLVLVSTAFVAVLSGPVERLAGRGR